MPALPIDPYLGEIVARVRERGAIVIQAEPGAGKTTRVPAALLDAGIDGEIMVLEPRRLAARLAATFVAESLGERVGERVGFRVRFEEAVSARTRLLFITEALLLRRLLADPALTGVGAVVFDEFHERHLAVDVGLAMVRRLQLGRRPDLKVVVMSATLEAGPVAAFLGDCPVVQVPGRQHPVSVSHLERPDERPLAQQIASAVARLDDDGDVLVFLPGAGEIRRAFEACTELARRRDLLLLPLHGDLPPAEQDRAVRRAAKRKVILSTNVAETSVTIDGVTRVIDSGLARIAADNPWSGLATLRVRAISRAAAVQRAGRAGRTRPGEAHRLYTQHDFQTRAAFEVPEIRRLELAETVLLLATLGVRAPHDFPWFDPPADEALGAAQLLLKRLGAIDAAGAITELGAKLAQLPVHPRQGRIALWASEHGMRDDGCLIAAMVGERDLSTERGAARQDGPSDLLHRRDLFREAERARFAHGAAERIGVHGHAARTLARVERQLIAAVARLGVKRLASGGDDALLTAVLAGYPDRVGRRPQPASDELLLAGGGRARLADSSIVRTAGWVVAIDAEEGQGRLPLVRLASAVEPDWLLDLFPERVKESDELVWDAEAERVIEQSRVTYEALVLDERRRTDVPVERAGPLVARQALATGIRGFVDPEALAQLVGRVRFLASLGVGAGLDDVALSRALEAAAHECRSFAELRAADLLNRIIGELDPQVMQRLPRWAPESIALPGGRKLTVHYEAGKPPWVESYLQDFFGSAEGPKLADGRVAVTLHLLAPSRRPVQVTSDLAGFWERHYPGLRNALARRYPKHAWPDDPRRAKPPEPRRR